MKLYIGLCILFVFLVPFSANSRSFANDLIPIRFVQSNPQKAMFIKLGPKAQQEPLKLDLGRRVQYSGQYGMDFQTPLLMFVSIPFAVVDLAISAGNLYARLSGKGLFGWGVAGVVLSGLTSSINTCLLFMSVYATPSGFLPFQIQLSFMAASLSSLIFSATNIHLWRKKTAMAKHQLALLPFARIERTTGNVHSGLLFSGVF